MQVFPNPWNKSSILSQVFVDMFAAWWNVLSRFLCWGKRGYPSMSNSLTIICSCLLFSSVRLPSYSYFPLLDSDGTTYTFMLWCLTCMFPCQCEPFNTVRTRQTYRPALSHVHLTLRLGIDAPILGFIWLLINQTVTTHPLPELLGVPHRQFMNVRLTLKNVLPARGLKHTISKWQPLVFLRGFCAARAVAQKATGWFGTPKMSWKMMHCWICWSAKFTNSGPLMALMLRLNVCGRFHPSHWGNASSKGSDVFQLQSSQKECHRNVFVLS